MKAVPSMCKTSGRYHGVSLGTELGSVRTPLITDTAGIAVDRARPSG
jgi:hypothetical protein